VSLFWACRLRRKDALSPEIKLIIKEFWDSNTRVYNNSRAVVGRRRRGCTPHVKQFKEESNTELYKKFKAKHPHIRSSRRRTNRGKHLAGSHVALRYLFCKSSLLDCF
jgi:hypothetical protein